MKRSTWTKLGIVELGALAILWRSAHAAPLVALERHFTDGAERSTRRFQRSVDCSRDQRRTG